MKDDPRLLLLFLLILFSLTVRAVAGTPEIGAKHLNIAVQDPSNISQIYGIDFSPYVDGQDPNVNPQVTTDQIRARMQIVAPYTVWVRSFSSTTGLENIPPIARSFGLKVAAGAWISRNLSQNTSEINNLIAAANAGQVDLAIVGSEALLRGDVTESQLIGYLNQVRTAIPSSIPITTADTFDVLLQHPNVINASDVIFTNIYPYWQGVAISNAICSAITSYQQIVAAANGKQVIISETGWPSDGNSVGAAVPSSANASQYFLQFASWARANNIPFYYFEGLDESWKANYEGPQGAHWGIWDKNGTLKPGMQDVFNGQRAATSCNSVLGHPGDPTIYFTYIPAIGSFDFLEGEVLHIAPSSTNVAVYIKVNGNWWTKPTFAQPLTPIQQDGSWSANIVTGGSDQQATEIAAFLVPDGYTPPLLGPSPTLPIGLYQNSLAHVQVVRAVNAIWGRITDTSGHPLSNINIILSGSNAAGTQSAADGKYSFPNLPDSSPVTITPISEDFSFSPISRSFSSSTGIQSADFIATAIISNAHPSVYIDTPAIADIVSGPIDVYGWAIDNTFAPGSAIDSSSVHVAVDGVLMGNATYGIPRADVCAAFSNRPDCPNVGFNFNLNPAQLTPGPHIVSVMATDTDSNSPDTGTTSKLIIVGSTRPSLYLDTPIAGGTVSGVITLYGWAIDNVAAPGTAIDSISLHILVDGIFIGNASYGISRPDVCNAYPGRAGCPNVGFSFPLDTTKLTPGTHMLTVTAIDTDSIQPDMGSVSVKITVTPVPPSVYIDSPTSGTIVSGPVTVYGWAIDNTTLLGTAIDPHSIQVSVDGIPVGSAVYGLQRNDVCAVFVGRIGCPNVGFSFLLNTAQLSPGSHVITVTATDTDGTQRDSGTATVNVTIAPTPPSVYIDTPSPGATLCGTVNVSGWAIDNTTTIGSAIGANGLQVLIDGTTMGTAIYGSNRPDVCSAYPGRLGCPNVGFTFALDTMPLTPGSHTLTVRATDTDSIPDTGAATISVSVASCPAAK